ncbi:hypothetical protein MXB_5103 [Myxobolus squamalis]|nr:hypothetical protein MXB_5103 [Myxobolus squamalis]
MSEYNGKSLDIVPIYSEKPNQHGITCVFYNEDHTLGNILLLDVSANVNFTGYSIPHPSDVKMNLRIQTIDIYPEPALKTALEQIKKTSESLLDIFNNAVTEFNQ